MPKLRKLFERNRAWAQSTKAHLPDFYAKLSQQDRPEYLWIGCSDSRVPANETVGLVSGEHFIHRNVGNVVVHTDTNCLSVIQYAVEVLEVKHIIVCGHYGCHGVKAAMNNESYGFVDNWLSHVRDVVLKHHVVLSHIQDDERCFKRLCELNVIEQVVNVCRTTVVRDAWERGQDLTAHGLIFDTSEGLLSDLAMSPSNREELSEMYHATVRLDL